MCGLAGFYQAPIRPFEPATITRMIAALVHRGPDDSGLWLDKSSGLALGHRRLAILDPSASGHQPMHSGCSRYVIVFNGEIYNHLDLRKCLQLAGKAPAWRGHTDTETLLACFSAWGVVRTLQATVGMFALALWDRQARQLTLARDRMGEKPLYYGWQGDVFLFGSELKALKAHPACHAEINRDALTLLLRHNCIPAPHCIYRGLAKLMPGHYLTLPLAASVGSNQVQPQAYWQLREVVEQGQDDLLSGTPEEVVELLQARLSDSIAAQMVADVPLGAFLSGGVDSSTIVALMQAQSRRPVCTFTIGFEESDYDEAAHASAVAHHLGTEHTELRIRPEDALAVIPRLPSMYCEPFSDSSQIPTILVSQMARQRVIVALSGDGGDELFGGYNRYLGACKVWHRMHCLPGFARQAAAYLLRTLPPSAWDRLYESAKPMLPKPLRLSTPGDKAHKLADVLALPNGQAFYHRLTSHWDNPASLVIGAREPKTLLTDPTTWPRTDSLEHWMMAMDTQTYMADDLLVKVDRAAMASSLESRVPLLDHRVVELAWRMPLDLKIRNGIGKWPLRQVLYRHVPRKLIERPKMGFGIPLHEWLRGPLRDWAEDLLDEECLRQGGYLQPKPIRQMWKEHQSKRHNWQHHLWDVLMLQAWLRQQ